MYVCQYTGYGWNDDDDKMYQKNSLNVGKISLVYADKADILMSVKVLTLVKHIGVYAIWGEKKNHHSFGLWPNEVFAFWTKHGLWSSLTKKHSQHCWSAKGVKTQWLWSLDEHWSSCTRTETRQRSSTDLTWLVAQGRTATLSASIGFRYGGICFSFGCPLLLVFCAVLIFLFFPWVWLWRVCVPLSTCVSLSVFCTWEQGDNYRVSKQREDTHQHL